jgi:hypothetical protein
MENSKIWWFGVMIFLAGRYFWQLL